MARQSARGGMVTGQIDTCINTEPEVLKYGPSLRGPCVKNEGLVFHGTARAIRLMNS